MNTLFMIGNGFDLNCGLKTSYINVYDEYVNTNSSSNVIKKFKNDIKIDYKNWSDFEIGMSKYALELDTELDFIECVDDFRSFLKAYLEKEEKEYMDFVAHISTTDKINAEVISSLQTFYEGITKNINSKMDYRNAGELRSIHFVSFNYTTILDHFINEAYKDIHGYTPSVLHIHGTLDDLTLGIDNEEQLSTIFPITNSSRRCFIKPFFNEEYDSQRISSAISEINNANTICIYGMSLGDSDLTWRNKLIDWLRNSSSNHLFIYDHSLVDYRTDIIHKRMAIEEKAKIQLLENWSVSEYDNFFNRLHIVCGRNIFNISQYV